ncbi:MAG: hypothetical protein AMJ72_12290 [Acidithiobacillales bacterium SM1_46]|nr:MAG: hypothetical protein AMJ72_12290 [Acidithiobacillales bacterium SM1_46]
MKDVTISYSIERAAGGFLVGADYFDETYTLPSRVSLDTLRAIARDRIRGERLPTATTKDDDGKVIVLYCWSSS